MRQIIQNQCAVGGMAIIPSGSETPVDRLLISRSLLVELGSYAATNREGGSCFRGGDGGEGDI